MFLCEHKLTVTRYAVKILEKKLLTKDTKFRYYKEIEMVSKLICPYIIYLREYYEDEERIYIIMEYCAGQSLLESVNKKNKKVETYTERQVAWVMHQLLKAVSYLHARNIIHRDIKAENIMFLDGPPGEGIARIKLIDFGCARSFKPHEKMNGVYGTSNYIAPEMISGEYTESADMFSCGVIFYTMLTMKLPFDDRTD